MLIEGCCKVIWVVAMLETSKDLQGNTRTMKAFSLGTREHFLRLNFMLHITVES